MFNLSGSEIVVILILALVVLGPEKLPDAMRKAGRTFAELKKLSTGFQDEVRKGFEEPVKEVRKTATAVRSAAKAPIDAIATPTTTGNDAKPRYNPALDPRPEHAEGSSVADPLPATGDVGTSGGSPGADVEVGSDSVTSDVAVESEESGPTDLVPRAATHEASAADPST